MTAKTAAAMKKPHPNLKPSLTVSPASPRGADEASRSERPASYAWPHTWQNRAFGARMVRQLGHEVGAGTESLYLAAQATRRRRHWRRLAILIP